jgi:hypothetical protein
MPIVSVSKYLLGWNPKTKNGRARISLQAGQVINVPVGSAEELSALAAILNESPVSFNTDTGEILTAGWEDVGGT